MGICTSFPSATVEEEVVLPFLGILGTLLEHVKNYFLFTSYELNCI